MLKGCYRCNLLNQPASTTERLSVNCVQDHLWTYYTGESPPLWIIPAWNIANLAINRIVRFLRITLPKHPRKPWVVLYWIIFPIFLVLMLPFVWPTMDKLLTILATLACFFIIISPTNHRTAVLTFVG